MIKDRKNRLWVILALSFFIAVPKNPAQAKNNQPITHTKLYTVEEAYEFFNRERTPFDPKRSKLSEYEIAYLEHYFSLTDRAMELRTNMMQYYFAGTRAHKKQLAAYITEIEKVIDAFPFVRAPTKELKEIENLTALAIGEQRDFFRAWSSANGRDFLKWRKKYMEHELVLSSHSKLQSAYTQLMLLFPHEDPYNQKAFYNHLCALDFI